MPDPPKVSLNLPLYSVLLKNGQLAAGAGLAMLWTTCQSKEKSKVQPLAKPKGKVTDKSKKLDQRIARNATRIMRKTCPLNLYCPRLAV
jgi:hypothetical protein